MAIAIKNISNGTVQTTQQAIINAVSSYKALVIKNMRFVNTHDTNSATLNVFFKGTSGGTGRRILPKDIVIAPKALLADDQELTLEAGNLVEAVVNSGATVDYVISGIERDV